MSISPKLWAGALGGACLLGALGASAAQQTMSPNQITAALHVIQRDAQRIAAGTYRGKSLQAPAHQIGVQWYKVEPVLAKNGGVLVEMRMANRAIAAFDKTWRQNAKARPAAQNVSATVADLIAARHQYPRATPAAMRPPAAAAGSPMPAASAVAASPSPSPTPTRSQASPGP